MIERTELPIEVLTLDPLQSRDRAWSGDEPDRRLADSIDSAGLYQDIIVRPLDDVGLGVTYTNTLSDVEQETEAESESEYAIIAGSRRYHAAMEAGHELVPCKIVRSSDVEAAWTSLSENTDRRDLSEQEIAQQLSLIYELVRPHEEPSACPACGTSVADEAALLRHCAQTACTLPEPSFEVGSGTSGDDFVGAGNQSRFATEKQTVEYLAQRYLGRTDKNALKIVRGHLRTATLPPILQSLFKNPDDRTAQERTAMSNYGIDTRTKLGSGDGRSGTSREVVALHETVATELETETIDPTDAVLEAVGSLRFEEMSEQELRRTLREFRHELTAELDEAPPTEHQEVFGDILQRQAGALKRSYEEIEPTRPFKKVDVLGPETQRHSRWHVQAMNRRNARGHGELVRELYQERLEQLADEQGWS